MVTTLVQLVQGFETCDFWIHVLWFPRKVCTLEIGQTVGEVFGRVSEVEVREYRNLELSFLRIRVSLEVGKPLIVAALW